MNLINLTSYTFQIGNRILVPMGKRCYIEYTDLPDTIIEEIPITRRLHGAVVNLPEPREDTMFVVDHSVRRKYGKDRYDLLSPGKTIKVEDGIIYLESLRRI